MNRQRRAARPFRGRSAQGVLDEQERLSGGLCTHLLAIALEAMAFGTHVTPVPDPEPSGTHRLLGGPSPRSRDAGDRDRDIGPKTFADPARHLLRNLLRDGSERVDVLLSDIEHPVLDLVGI